MADYKLDSLLAQVRRIEEHREKGAEAKIRKTYQALLKELRHYLADEYTAFAEDDALTYGILQKHGYYAHFLEEVEKKINDISPEVRRLIRSTVDQTYEATYNGMVESVKKAAQGVDLGALKGCTPDVIKRAVENPISKLTLNDRLEKHRKEIVYDIKQNISVGLMNGDRYSTMANRIKQSVEGNYKKAIRIARTETHRVREAGNQDAAISVNGALKESTAGITMTKTWRTMKDERVRPSGKAKKYNHRKMEGITIPVDEEFTLPSGTKTMAPGQSGVAGEDINCRCYLSYGLQKVQESDNIKPKDYSKKEAINHLKEDYGIEFSDSRKYPMDEELLNDCVQWLDGFNSKYSEFSKKNPVRLPVIKCQAPSNMKGCVGYYSYYPNQAKAVELALNGAYHSDVKVFQDYVDRSIKTNWYPANATVHKTFVHEYGHYVSHSIIDWQHDFISDCIRDFNRDTGERIQSFKECEDLVSRYGVSSEGELFAEAFAEYFGGENPRRFALIFGRNLEEKLKGVK